MKHKIIITESQYKKLLKNINEQQNWTPQLRMTSKAAPAWLSVIIGNKQDGFTFHLPPSTKPEDVNTIISDGEVEEYNKKKSIAQEIGYKLGERNYNHFITTMLKKDPKYRAMMIKVYEQLKQTTDGNITVLFNRIRKTTENKPKPNSGTESPIKIKFPITDDLESKKYFVDNSWELDETFKKEFRDIIFPKIKEALVKTPNSKATLNGLTVRTACSTLPNGTSPDGKVYSFAQLSKLRNQSAKNWVVKELQSIGVTISPNLVYQDDWKGNLTGEYLGANSHSGDIWGKPGASKNNKDYEKDKYLKIELDLDIIGSFKQTTDPEKTQTTYDYDYNYESAFKVPDIPRRIPGIELAYVWNPKTESKCKVGESGVSMECETWGSGPKDWSTNLKSDIYFGKEPN